mgnify:FL=1|tara:strand:- start:1744 stop:2586 length:843 start_codon:yes stop_codon:yes gene_type:complete
MKIKHSKYKNTGILFELLSRQLTSDTVEGNTTHSLDLIKKYFKKGTMLCEELQHYSVLTNNKYKDPKKSEILLEAVLKKRENLKTKQLAAEKYNLIKEIKKYYSIDNFFKAKIQNYSEQASIYTLFETISKNTSPTLLVEAKFKVLDNLNEVENKSFKKDIFDEFKEYDKDVRLLSYKAVVESFNKKYSHLGPNQKNLLSEYINEVSDTPKLKKYTNNCITEIKQKIKAHHTRTKDDAIKVKLEEVSKILRPVDRVLKDSDINNVLNYYELIRELDKVNG